MNYKGVLIEESLNDKTLLALLDVSSRVIEPVVEEDKTPWLEFWTLVSFEVPEDKADAIARRISESLEAEHGTSWYADFKNDKWHYIIFRGRIFKVDRHVPSDYDEVKAYGLTLGIPEHQLDFSPDVVI